MHKFTAQVRRPTPILLIKGVRRILVRGSMSPCHLRRRKCWKSDYEMVHSEVYLNKYEYIHFPGGQLTPFAPMCGPPMLLMLTVTFLCCSDIYISVWSSNCAKCAVRSAQIGTTAQLFGVEMHVRTNSSGRVCLEFYQSDICRFTAMTFLPLHWVVSCKFFYHLFTKNNTNNAQTT